MNRPAIDVYADGSGRYTCPLVACAYHTDEIDALCDHLDDAHALLDKILSGEVVVHE